jgi:hypothetical protein
VTRVVMAFPELFTRGEGSTSYLKQMGDWQLHRAAECRGQRLPGLEIGSWARYWLQSLKDPFAIETMRAVLLKEGFSPSLHRFRDEDVIDHVAQLLKSGRWHVCERVMRVYPVIASTEPGILSVPRRGPVPSEPSRFFADTQDQPTLAGNADQGAIASVLIHAAIDGEPFCEECAKAARMAASRAVATL